MSFCVIGYDYIYIAAFISQGIELFIEEKKSSLEKVILLIFSTFGSLDNSMQINKIGKQKKSSNTNPVNLFFSDGSEVSVNRTFECDF